MSEVKSGKAVVKTVEQYRLDFTRATISMSVALLDQVIDISVNFIDENGQILCETPGHEFVSFDEFNRVHGADISSYSYLRLRLPSNTTTLQYVNELLDELREQQEKPES